MLRDGNIKEIGGLMINAIRSLIISIIAIAAFLAGDNVYKLIAEDVMCCLGFCVMIGVFYVHYRVLKFGVKTTGTILTKLGS